MLKDEFLGKGSDHVAVRLKVNRIEGLLRVTDKSKKSEHREKVS